MIRHLVLFALPFLAALPTRADEPNWIAKRTLAAPEAHQAAAADERFVFAITSTGIGKYDRRTGERVAVSSGAAMHLNSGFLHEGRLLCAHSNYPQRAERSEIKSLNPATMSLTTFHDFGNFGGSLVWVLRHDEAWWCNFALYGDRNAETFLVRFDDDWHETGRWTYPPEVLRHIGRNSLSGGVWRCGTLLVTDHDHPAIYELRLPEEGSVLESVGMRTAPFTGQGIAADPVTGGLVGIDRARRQIVFAELAVGAGSVRRRLRVLSYNIHHAEGVDGRLDLERIAKVIRTARPDVVALQEVDQRVQRTNIVDQPARLAELTKLHVVFGGNIELEGGRYGNAILSRWPIHESRNRSLPNVDDGEQRGLLVAEIGWPGPDDRLPLFATHLDHRRGDAERLASASAIDELANELGERLALLAGDLNAGPQSDVLKRLAQAWTRPAGDPRPTIPVAEPTRQIDFVLFRPARRWRVCEVRVLDEAVASDHRPLLVVLELVEGLDEPASEGPRKEKGAPGTWPRTP